MTKSLLAMKVVGAESGAKTRGGFVGSVGESGHRNEPPADMLASAPPNSKSTFESGSEPSSVLLAMAWTAIETLLAREQARLFVGNGEVAVIFANTSYSETEGLLAK